MRAAANVLLVILFVFVISLPLAVNLAGVDGADAAAENRELAGFPRFQASLRGAAAYADGASNWFEDHFGFRARLVRWYGESRLFWLGVSPSSSVLTAATAGFFMPTMARWTTSRMNRC